eukprot:6195800-Pleurochrysis_carterae.AAC.1
MAAVGTLRAPYAFASRALSHFRYFLRRAPLFAHCSASISSRAFLALTTSRALFGAQMCAGAEAAV